MKILTALAAIAIALPSSALAQDPVQVDPAHYKVLAENDAVRVLKIDYPVGEKSKMHSHPDAIFIPLGDATGTFEGADGSKAERTMKSEQAMYTPADTHSPSNTGKTPVNGILIEFKAAKPGTATLPTSSRADMKTTVLAEGPYATAYRVTAAPGFKEPLGTTHEFAQVSVVLGPMDMWLSLDGKPAITSWKRGDVALFAHKEPHESRNTGSTPQSFILVAVK